MTAETLDPAPGCPVCRHWNLAHVWTRRRSLGRDLWVLTGNADRRNPKRDAEGHHPDCPFALWRRKEPCGS